MQNPSSPIVVTAYGMITSLGGVGDDVCAAASAGITRPQPLEYDVYWEEEGTMEPVSGFCAPAGMTFGFTGLGLLARLGGLALKDLVTVFQPRMPARTAMLLNISSGFFLQQEDVMEAEELGEEADSNPSEELKARFDHYDRNLPNKITEFAGLAWEPLVQKVFHHDAAGVVPVLAEAERLLQSGEVDACLVGGIDSLVALEVLTALGKLDLLHHNQQPHGLIPGEAGVMLLLESCDVARKADRPILGRISAPVSAREKAHLLDGDKEYGAALAKVITETRSHIMGESVVFGSLNGIPHAAWQWGFAQTRQNPQLEAELITPASFFGDIGAAYGFLTICLAISAHKDQDALVWCASPDGLAGSFNLSLRGD